MEEKMKKIKAQAWEDVIKTKDELKLRIDELEKNHMDYTQDNSIKHHEASL